MFRNLINVLRLDYSLNKKRKFSKKYVSIASIKRDVQDVQIVESAKSRRQVAYQKLLYRYCPS